MGYDSKGILVFNLKYEHAISFINLVKFINYYQMQRSTSSKLFVIASGGGEANVYDHRIIEILGLRPSNRMPVSYYINLWTVICFLKYDSFSNYEQSYYRNIGYCEGIYTCENLTFHLQTEKDVKFVSEMVCLHNAYIPWK